MSRHIAGANTQLKRFKSCSVRVSPQQRKFLVKGNLIIGAIMWHQSQAAFLEEIIAI